jgi:tetratricopeptide (TPR) repeat protein
MSERDDLEYMLNAARAGEHARVVERGAAVLASGADPSSVIMLYGDALEELGRTSEARDAFTLALTILPAARHRRVLDALAVLELHAGSYAAAETYCERAIALDPDHASAHVYLGNVYSHTDRVADAELQFARATDCSEGAIDEAWYNLGGVQLKLGRTSEAESSFRRALAIDPDYELALEALASLDHDRDRPTHS